jgi:hypothetical protein
VAQQIHLQNGFFDCHGLNGELFGANNLKIGIAGFHRNRIRRIGTAAEGIRAKAAGQSGLILSNLTFNGGNCGVNRGHHIAGGFLGPEVGVAGMNGKLNAAVLLFHPEGDRSLCISTEVTLQLADLFFGIGLYGGIYRALSFV